MDPLTLGLGIVGLIIFIITLVSILQNNNHGVGGKVLWIAIAFFLNWIGSILWLLIGRGRRR
ncbi:PLDc N-terminal domain-containing protein [Homoserinibacter sp. YIM 151385]|uniref:PLDc N-terminal domain-containing protein n=1 Tax=Homoserinibacter sp. YIM 151385 TaxID=2985506 RepID=UPI0022F05031|nr:PLDc N-terminal domain-containing protein [Homoserinibacter sp. YIM 151385]WBU39075.1 PLDc N-terminal domain-containing protein [Homoserinibacter sp. YIM 151385]